jgi:hypothetical protein
MNSENVILDGSHWNTIAEQTKNESAQAGK